MTLYELLVTTENVTMEVNFYRNHEHYIEDKPCVLTQVELDTSNKLLLEYYNKKIDIDFTKCKVFYIGYMSNRSRILKINVDVQEDK